MTDFKNGQELLEVCKKKQCSISEVMKQREIEGTSSTKKEVGASSTSTASTRRCSPSP